VERRGGAGAGVGVGMKPLRKGKTGKAEEKGKVSTVELLGLTSLIFFE